MSRCIFCNTEEKNLTTVTFSDGTKGELCAECNSKLAEEVCRVCGKYTHRSTLLAYKKGLCLTCMQQAKGKEKKNELDELHGTSLGAGGEMTDEQFENWLMTGGNTSYTVEDMVSSINSKCGANLELQCLWTDVKMTLGGVSASNTDTVLFNKYREQVMQVLRDYFVSKIQKKWCKVVIIEGTDLNSAAQVLSNKYKSILCKSDDPNGVKGNQKGNVFVCELHNLA